MPFSNVPHWQAANGRDAQWRQAAQMEVRRYALQDLREFYLVSLKRP